MIVAGLLFAAAAVASPAPETPVPDPIDGGGGIVYGDNLGAVVTAPEGWIFDSGSGVPQGLHAVMYPRGSTWSSAAAVMYVNFAHLDAGKTIDDAIADDIADQRTQSPDLAVEAAEPIALRGGDKASVRLLTNDAWKNREAVAYAMHGSAVAVFVLSCRSEESFQASLPAFREMVEGATLLDVVVEGP